MFVPFMAALIRCLVNLFTTGGFRQDTAKGELIGRFD